MSKKVLKIQNKSEEDNGSAFQNRNFEGDPIKEEDEEDVVEITVDDILDCSEIDTEDKLDNENPHLPQKSDHLPKPKNANTENLLTNTDNQETTVNKSGESVMTKLYSSVINSAIPCGNIPNNTINLDLVDELSSQLRIKPGNVTTDKVIISNNKKSSTQKKTKIIITCKKEKIGNNNAEAPKQENLLKKMLATPIEKLRPSQSSHSESDFEEKLPSHKLNSSKDPTYLIDKLLKSTPEDNSSENQSATKDMKNNTDEVVLISDSEEESDNPTEKQEESDKNVEDYSSLLSKQLNIVVKYVPEKHQIVIENHTDFNINVSDPSLLEQAGLSNENFGVNLISNPLQANNFLTNENLFYTNVVSTLNNVLITENTANNGATIIATNISDELAPIISNKTKKGKNVEVSNKESNYESNKSPRKLRVIKSKHERESKLIKIEICHNLEVSNSPASNSSTTNISKELTTIKSKANVASENVSEINQIDSPGSNPSTNTIGKKLRKIEINANNASEKLSEINKIDSPASNPTTDIISRKLKKIKSEGNEASEKVSESNIRINVNGCKSVTSKKNKKNKKEKNKKNKKGKKNIVSKSVTELNNVVAAILNFTTKDNEPSANASSINNVPCNNQIASSTSSDLNSDMENCMDLTLADNLIKKPADVQKNIMESPEKNPNIANGSDNDSDSNHLVIREEEPAREINVKKKKRKPGYKTSKEMMKQMLKSDLKNENGFFCPIDGCLFKTSARDKKLIMWAHVTSAHSQNGKEQEHGYPLFRCTDEKCPEKFQTKKDMIMHVFNYHRNGEGVACLLCTHKAKNQSHISNHFKLHGRYIKEIGHMRCPLCNYVMVNCAYKHLLYHHKKLERSKITEEQRFTEEEEKRDKSSTTISDVLNIQTDHEQSNVISNQDQKHTIITHQEIMDIKPELIKNQKSNWEMNINKPEVPINQEVIDVKSEEIIKNQKSNQKIIVNKSEEIIENQKLSFEMINIKPEIISEEEIITLMNHKSDLNVNQDIIEIIDKKPKLENTNEINDGTTRNKLDNRKSLIKKQTTKDKTECLMQEFEKSLTNVHNSSRTSVLKKNWREGLYRVIKPSDLSDNDINNIQKEFESVLERHSTEDFEDAPRKKKTCVITGQTAKNLIPFKGKPKIKENSHVPKNGTETTKGVVNVENKSLKIDGPEQTKSTQKTNKDRILNKRRSTEDFRESQPKKIKTESSSFQNNEGKNYAEAVSDKFYKSTSVSLVHIKKSI